jgi:hypothetical protein
MSVRYEPVVGLAGFEPATPRSPNLRLSVVCSSCTLTFSEAHAELQALLVVGGGFLS